MDILSSDDICNFIDLFLSMDEDSKDDYLSDILDFIDVIDTESIILPDEFEEKYLLLKKRIFP